jgi:hypothetical protein
MHIRTGVVRRYILLAAHRTCDYRIIIIRYHNRVTACDCVVRSIPGTPCHCCQSCVEGYIIQGATGTCGNTCQIICK